MRTSSFRNTYQSSTNKTVAFSFTELFRRATTAGFYALTSCTTGCKLPESSREVCADEAIEIRVKGRVQVSKNASDLRQPDAFVALVKAVKAVSAPSFAGECASNSLLQTRRYLVVRVVDSFYLRQVNNVERQPQSDEADDERDAHERDSLFS